MKKTFLIATMLLINTAHTPHIDGMKKIFKNIGKKKLLFPSINNTVNFQNKKFYTTDEDKFQNKLRSELLNYQLGKAQKLHKELVKERVSHTINLFFMTLVISLIDDGIASLLLLSIGTSAQALHTYITIKKCITLKACNNDRLYERVNPLRDTLLFEKTKNLDFILRKLEDETNIDLEGMLVLYSQQLKFEKKLISSNSHLIDFEKSLEYEKKVLALKGIDEEMMVVEILKEKLGYKNAQKILGN